MKRRYIISILVIITIMVCAVGVYIFNILSDSPSFINNMSGSGKVDNYLSHDGIVFKSEKTLYATKTMLGYEALSSSEERSCYYLIKQNVEEITDEKYKNTNSYKIKSIVVQNCHMNLSAIKKALYAFQYDNVDVFWISNTFAYSYNGKDTIITLCSSFSKSSLLDAKKKLDLKVSDIISKVPKNFSQYEIELYLHDYIISNCCYKNFSNNFNLYTAYGSLIENQAVCEGFSKAMKLLLGKMGIKCGLVTGSRKNEAHMWNVVEIDGKWYHLDVTWDAAGDLQRYDHFNVSDEIIKKTHNINDNADSSSDFSGSNKYNLGIPICDSMEQNYFEKNAVKVGSLDENDQIRVIDKLVNLASQKKECIHVAIDSKENFKNIQKKFILQNNAVYFNCVARANEKLITGHKINSTQSQFSVNDAQNVITLKLIYS